MVKGVLSVIVDILPISIVLVNRCFLKFCYFALFFEWLLCQIVYDLKKFLKIAINTALKFLIENFVRAHLARFEALSSYLVLVKVKRVLSSITLAIFLNLLRLDKRYLSRFIQGNPLNG